MNILYMFEYYVSDGEGDRLSAEESNALASGQATAAQLHNVRLKLEEKRRRMEQDKRKMELALSRQRQQLGQQAFLQAVTRVRKYFGCIFGR